MGNGTVGPELASLIRGYQQHQRNKERPFAALSWVLTAHYVDTEEEARDHMAELPVGQRAAIVDLTSGDTWTLGRVLPEVRTLLETEATAPDQLRPSGRLVSLSRPLPRRNGSG